jgi:hypothetical protein
MARLNIAMLSNTQQAAQINDSNLIVDSDVLDIKTIDNQINSENEIVDEANDSIDAINGIADKLHTQNQLPQEAVQVAQEMMGYLSKRTGIKFSGVNMAMESSPSSPNKKQNIIKELKAANKSIESRVSIAQEGVLDKIKYKFSLMFATNKKLEKELKVVSSNYDKNGVKTGIIKSPAFASALAVRGKDTVDGQDVIKFAEMAERTLKAPEFMRQINELSSTMDRLTMALTKGGFFSSDKGIKEIEELQETIIEMNQKIHQDYRIEERSGKVDAVPLEHDDKETLVPIIFSLLDDTEFKRAEENLARAVGGYIQAYDVAVETRIMGEFSKDLRYVVQVHNLANQSYRKLNDVITQSFYIAHACVKYIKASTKS